MSRRAALVRSSVALSVFAVVAGISLPVTSAGAASPFKGKIYVSLGDSYSVGFQPLPSPAATSGYTGYVASKLKMTLDNFGCGGATTTSILEFTGVCPLPAATAAGPVIPGDTQLENAQAFISTPANFGKVGLVTISIGGNDVTSCISTPDPVTCVLDRMNGTVDATFNPDGDNVPANVESLVSEIEDSLVANGDASAPILGLTYPDVILGTWVFPTFSPAPGNALPGQSVLAFEALINPALKTAYQSVSTGKFVDVTAATGAYIPFSTVQGMPKSTGVTDVPKGTKVPKALVDVCKLTYFCKVGDIHANTTGYTVIGKLIKKNA